MNRRDEFLKTQKVLHLTTIGSNKIPHVVPVWYMYSLKKSTLAQTPEHKRQKT